MIERIKVGKCYKHFKGNLYFILHIAIDSETGEQIVVYRALYGERLIYTRPLKMFAEAIDTSRSDNVTGQKYRFEQYDIIT